MMLVNNGLENIHLHHKELLGAVREKYSTVPIPGPEVSLDEPPLRRQKRQQTEKDQLVEQLRTNLEEVSNKVRYETEARKLRKSTKVDASKYQLIFI